MKRNSLLVLGFGLLAGAGLMAPGCGDDNPKKGTGLDGSADVKKDSGSGIDLKGTGGALGTGGAIGAGGAMGMDGAAGAGGSDGGMVYLDTGTGPEPSVDGSIVNLDVRRDLGGNDAVDAPLPGLDGPTDTTKLDVRVDTATIDLKPVQLDGGVDSTPVSLDSGVDMAEEDAAASEDATPMLDAEIDSEIDAEVDAS
jgi:hypothetical protein